MMLGDPDVELRDDEGKGKRLHTFHTCDPQPTQHPTVQCFVPQKDTGACNM